jgi:hypothetical protein
MHRHGLEFLDPLGPVGAHGDWAAAHDLAARRDEWVPVDDPRCQQFRPPADTSWLLGNCFKIIMMQAGFAVVESSFVRQRNSANMYAPGSAQARAAVARSLARTHARTARPRH